MENASKALIIAGAILLAILLISLAIMIFTTASDTVRGSGMTDAQIIAFNEKFTKYEGKQKGSSIRTLVNEVLASNASNSSGDGHFITIGGSTSGGTALVALTTSATTPTYDSGFKNTQTYTVTCEMNKDGLVSNIKITTN